MKSIPTTLPKDESKATTPVKRCYCPSEEGETKREPMLGMPFFKLFLMDVQTPFPFEDAFDWKTESQFFE